jgi:hypothetical protein
MVVDWIHVAQSMAKERLLQMELLNAVFSMTENVKNLSIFHFIYIYIHTYNTGLICLRIGISGRLL